MWSQLKFILDSRMLMEAFAGTWCRGLPKSSEVIFWTSGPNEQIIHGVAYSWKTQLPTQGRNEALAASKEVISSNLFLAQSFIPGAQLSSLNNQISTERQTVAIPSPSQCHTARYLCCVGTSQITYIISVLHIFLSILTPVQVSSNVVNGSRYIWTHRIRWI